MNEFFNVIDSLLNPYWFQQGFTPIEKTPISIPVNIYQEEDGSGTVEIAIPGKTKDDVSLEKKVVDGVNYLVFNLVEKDEETTEETTEETKEEKEPKRKELLKKIKVTRHCEIKVPPTQDIDNLKAKVENGLLTITLPAVEAVKPVKFEIE
jgi:HSP20 family molecular chaperone IbpA